MSYPEEDKFKEISPEQAAAFNAVIKGLLPNLVPNAVLGEQMTKIWLEIDPDADPAVMKEAFTDHVFMSGEQSHILDGREVKLSYYEGQDDTRSETRLINTYTIDNYALGLMQWFYVDNGTKPKYRGSTRVSDRAGKQVDLSLDNFLELANQRAPEIRQAYRDFEMVALLPSPDDFSVSRLGDVMAILSQLGEHTIDRSLDFLKEI